MSKDKLGASSHLPKTAKGFRTVVLVFAMTLIAPAAYATGLVGLWNSATTSRGGIGHTLEFRADGTFVLAVTVMVDEYYRVIGDRLVVGEQPLGADADASKGSRIKIGGDVLEQTGPDGSVVRKERIGPAAGESKIVGAWRYRHYTDAVAFERYTNDGRMLFRLPMTSSVGRYKLNGNDLLLVRPNQADVKMTFELRGDTLSLLSQGEATGYRRDTAGPWYEREHIVRYPKK